MAMYGCGVFLTGDSGTGKSELALRLIRRGHALVADDTPEFKREEGRWVGRAPVALQGRLQLRGLGVIDVPSLFGPSAIKESVTVDLLIALTRQPDTQAHTLGGSDPIRLDFLDSVVPGWSLPVDRAPACPEWVETAVLAAGLDSTRERLPERSTWN